MFVSSGSECISCVSQLVDAIVHLLWGRPAGRIKEASTEIFWRAKLFIHHLHSVNASTDIHICAFKKKTDNEKPAGHVTNDWLFIYFTQHWGIIHRWHHFVIQADLISAFYFPVLTLCFMRYFIYWWNIHLLAGNPVSTRTALKFNLFSKSQTCSCDIITSFYFAYFV